jgi:glycosyltransferase involved in cell wall biosynthesis
MTATPQISIIIASHRQEYIPALCAKLGPSLWGDIPTETLIAADYPVDSMRNRFPRITWLYVNDFSISAKRNACLRQARGALVACIDDDCVPCDGWLLVAARRFADHPELTGLEGRTTIETTRGDTGAASQFRRLETRGYRTNNICYRRAALLDAGMFDERFTVQREDLDLAFTILENGGIIEYEPAMRVIHRHRPGEKWDLLKNCVNRRFDPLLFRKHSRRYRDFIGSPAPGGIKLICVAHLLLALAVVSGRFFFVAACALDAALITAVTLRRVRGARMSVSQYVRELASAALSPIVLLAALAYGSVRYRKLLLW